MKIFRNIVTATYDHIIEKHEKKMVLQGIKPIDQGAIKNYKIISGKKVTNG